MRSVNAGIGLLVLLLSPPALAQSDRLRLSAWGSFVGVSGTTTVDDAYGVKVAFDNGWGAGLGVGYAFTDLLEAELAVSYERTRGELDVAGSKGLDLGHLRMVPVSALVKVHPVKGGGVDPWLGVGGAYVSFGNLDSDDLTAAGLGSIEVKSKAALELAAGVAFKLAPKLGVFVEGRYMPLKPTSRGASGSETDLKLNPLALSLGVRLGL